jgi:hypothetical protein
VNLVSVLVLLGGAFLGGRWFGIAGVAAAASASLGFQNIAAWVLAKRLAGVWTHLGWVRRAEPPAEAVRGSTVAVPASESQSRFQGDWSISWREIDPAAHTQAENMGPVPSESLSESGEGVGFAGDAAGAARIGTVPWERLPADEAAGANAAVLTARLPAASSKKPIILTRLWWLDPFVIFSTMSGFTLLAACAIPDHVYMYHNTPKYVNWSHVSLAVVAFLTFLVGCRVATARPGGGVAAMQPSWDTDLRRWFYLSCGLTGIGYLCWLIFAVRNGFTASLLADMLWNPDVGLSDYIKSEVFATVPGVTTFTQFAPAAVLLGTWLALRRVPWVLAPLLVVLVTTAGRAFFLSERLALLEVALPCIILAVRARLLGCPISRRLGAAVHAMPVVGVVLVALLFSTCEYFRSWPYYQRTENSFVEFASWRLTAYYITSHNNGAMALECRGEMPCLPLPYYTLHQFWRFPLIAHSNYSYESLTGIDPDEDRTAMLARFGSVEFNNEGGLFVPMLEYGFLGFPIFWFAYGWIAGKLYRGFLLGSVTGLMFYPIVVLSLLEIPRILYLPSSRVFPSLVLLAVVAIVFARRSHAGESDFRQPVANALEQDPD